jgi:hypothetical protein
VCVSRKIELGILTPSSSIFFRFKFEWGTPALLWSPSWVLNCWN